MLVVDEFLHPSMCSDACVLVPLRFVASLHRLIMSRIVLFSSLLSSCNSLRAMYRSYRSEVREFTSSVDESSSAIMHNYALHKLYNQRS